MENLRVGWDHDQRLFSQRHVLFTRLVYEHWSHPKIIRKNNMKWEPLSLRCCQPTLLASQDSLYGAEDCRDCKAGQTQFKYRFFLSFLSPRTKQSEKLIWCHARLVTSSEDMQDQLHRQLIIVGRSAYDSNVPNSRVRMKTRKKWTAEQRNVENNSIRYFFSFSPIWTTYKAASLTILPTTHFDGEPLHSVTVRRLVRNHIFSTASTVSSKSEEVSSW